MRIILPPNGHSSDVKLYDNEGNCIIEKLEELSLYIKSFYISAEAGNSVKIEFQVITHGNCEIEIPSNLIETIDGGL